MTRSDTNRQLFWVLGTAIMIGCLFVLLFFRSYAAPEKDMDTLKGRVLFISSYSYSRGTVQDQVRGIMENLGDGVSLDFEYMDTYRASDETALQLFYDGLKYRLSQVEPYDVVILGDDAALHFALEHREDLFPATPLVFEGINDEALALEAAKDPLITGVLESLSIRENIELGMKINSQAVRVVAILDDSITGKTVRESYYNCQDDFPNLDFLEINSSSLSADQLKKELQHVSKYSILLFFLLTEDGDGNHYSNVEARRLIREHVSVPTICMLETDVGDGILGGKVASLARSGEIAAQIAMDILVGKNVTASGQVIESPNIYCVDYNMMKKYDVHMSVLPKETYALNQRPNFFERNREAVIPGIFLIIALLGVMGVVIFDNVRGRRMQKELGEAKSIMESASQHDFLTGLPNRSKFTDDLEEVIGEEKPCTIIMLDIDDFKKINDTYGHKAGDEALKQVAARLKELTSPILSAYRYAGDEFIMIQRSNQRKIVEKTAFQCRQIFSKEFVLAGEKRKICGSIGLACYPDDTDNMEQLIVYADDAMYQVKKNGKNDFAFYQKRETNPEDEAEDEAEESLGGAEEQKEPEVKPEDKPEE